MSKMKVAMISLLMGVVGFALGYSVNRKSQTAKPAKVQTAKSKTNKARRSVAKPTIGFASVNGNHKYASNRDIKIADSNIAVLKSHIRHLAKARGCGNGRIDRGEECDLGDQNGGYLCSLVCTESVCGNGSLEKAEQCDDGNSYNGDGCNSQCKREICGNGVKDVGEDCDYGTKNGGFCSTNCRFSNLH